MDANLKKSIKVSLKPADIKRSMKDMATPEAARQEVSQFQHLAGKYLTFLLGNEAYAIPVLKVREIIRMIPITAVPQMPDYIKGVLNLRGKIVPVVDLRLRFGIGTGAVTDRTCIVVVQLQSRAKRELLMGMVVDEVEEVLNINAGDIQETPDFGVSVDTSYILGMAMVKGKVKAILDIQKVVAAETIETAAEAGLTQ